MDAIWGLVFTAIAAFVGLVLLLSFETTANWVGLGASTPTGLPGYFRGLMGGNKTAPTS